MITFTKPNLSQNIYYKIFDKENRNFNYSTFLLQNSYNYIKQLNHTRITFLTPVVRHVIVISLLISTFRKKEAKKKRDRTLKKFAFCYLPWKKNILNWKVIDFTFYFKWIYKIVREKKWSKNLIFKICVFYDKKKYLCILHYFILIHELQ